MCSGWAAVMQQMIAHHENAVEMAKSLLKFADKDDMFHGPKSKKQVKDLATTIINAQSFQITEMVLCKWPPFEPGNHPSRPEHGLIPRVFAADLNGLSNDFPCVTQYTNEYGVPDPTAPGIPFCSAAWSKRKGTLAPSLAHAPPQGMHCGRGEEVWSSIASFLDLSILT